MGRRPGWWARNKHRYPPDWREISDAVKAAAHWRCEACGSPSVPGRVLTTDHIVDHDPANCQSWNLAALCQVCHLRRHNLRPKPSTKPEAIARLRLRHRLEMSQLALGLEVES